MIVLFYSAQDPAGVKTAEALRKKRACEQFQLEGHNAWRFDGFNLVKLDCGLLEAEVADSFGAELAVFLSKHRSESGKECFTVHPTGNFGPAAHGGKQGELSVTSAQWMRRFYSSLQEKTGNVFREATHHGPLLETPSLFVEIGSDESAWVKRENSEALADAVLAGLVRRDSGKVAIGFGGTHYCTSFTHLLKDCAFSHVASKHSLDFVNKELVAQMVSKTVEPVEVAFIDWKGCKKEQRDKIIPWLEEIGLKWERV